MQTSKSTAHDERSTMLTRVLQVVKTHQTMDHVLPKTQGSRFELAVSQQHTASRRIANPILWSRSEHLPLHDHQVVSKLYLQKHYRSSLASFGVLLSPFNLVFIYQ